MAVDEMMEWFVFMDKEPIGELRADYRSGIIASVFANCNRAKNTKVFHPEDFMPFFTPFKPAIQAPPAGWAVMIKN